MSTRNICSAKSVGAFGGSIFCVATRFAEPLDACQGAPCLLLLVKEFGLFCNLACCAGAGNTVKPQNDSSSAGVVLVRIASSRRIWVRNAMGGIESNKGLAA